MDRAANIRAALEADGWEPEEIRTALEEHAVSTGAEARAAAAGIPPVFRGVTWDMIAEDQARAEAVIEAKHWAEGSSAHRGLYLWGSGYGNGKTLIAAAAAGRILERSSRPVRWLDVVRLLTDLRLPFSDPGYAKAARRLEAPGLLEVIILDDIDKAPATDRNIQPVFALVNDAVNAETPLIVTANRSLDGLASDFGERFGKALASRLVGHCLDVEVGGRDRRLDP